MAYVDPKITHAAEPFRSALAALLAEADGKVWIGNAYRSNAEQIRLRGDNGCRGREFDRSCKGSPTTAVPGSSNHEWGLAADLEGDKRLAARLAPKYLMHFPVPGEDWHIEKIGVNRKTFPNAKPEIAGGSGSPTAVETVDGVAASITDQLTGQITTDPWSTLTSTHTWLRVFYVIAGGVAVIVGTIVTARDLRG